MPNYVCVGCGAPALNVANWSCGRCGGAVLGGKTVKPAPDYSGMEPRKNPRQPIFRDHNCGGCDSGRLPCKEGNYNSCSWPRARND